MVFMMTQQQFTTDQGAELSIPPPPPECPRCRSTNTKFCYYNNYNKSQPRYFCKSCKRHWTKGGTLRNIPAGSRRKSKRPSPSAAAAEPRQKHLLNSLSTDHKSMSGILFRALVHSSSTDRFNFQSTILESNGTTNYNANPNAEVITFSNHQFSNDDYVVNLDSTEEPTGAPPPQNYNMAAVDAAELWRWSEIDSLAWDHHFDPFKNFFQDSYLS